MADSESGPEARVLATFHRAVREMAWYRTVLAEQQVAAERIVDIAAFSALCPLLTKTNTFDRFPIAELAATTTIAGLASVLTSSGHSGRFSFGLQTRGQVAADAEAIDDALDEVFGIKSRATLAINCLPMGVGFASNCMTIAAISVREDMAVALIQAFGASYAQILLIADPLFMKRLLDHATSRDLDWRRHRVHVVLGEESFGEHFRGYVAAQLGLDRDRPEHGAITSSFGTGELGLHLLFETPATIALRRAAADDPALALALSGVRVAGRPLPMLFAFNPGRTFVEVVDPDASGYGRLTISLLDPTLPVPLLRFQSGDLGRLVETRAVAEALRRGGGSVPPDLPESLLALEGRESERLSNGSHVGVYKDALYADHEVARRITGAFRVTVSTDGCTMHVQLVQSAAPLEQFESRLLAAIPEVGRPTRLVLWPYERFPFGMTIDYERKFTYWTPDRPEA